MTVADARALLETLARRGFEVTLAAGESGRGPHQRFRVRGPAPVPAPLRAALVAHRSEVAALLATYPCTQCGRFHFPRPVRCYWCRSGPR